MSKLFALAVFAATLAPSQGSTGPDENAPTLPAAALMEARVTAAELRTRVLALHKRKRAERRLRRLVTSKPGPEALSAIGR